MWELCRNDNARHTFLSGFPFYMHDEFFTLSTTMQHVNYFGLPLENSQSLENPGQERNWRSAKSQCLSRNCSVWAFFFR